MRRGSLRDEEHLDEVTPELAEIARGRIFGAFEFRIAVAPGARETLRLAGRFRRRRTRRCADATSKHLCTMPRALDETQRYYGEKLADARFMVPSPVISRGVVWAKANMLRVIKEYPHGWGATNSPPSDILVSRDTSWFVHGFDYFCPTSAATRSSCSTATSKSRARSSNTCAASSGFRTSYDLNINDDTPLHLIAILHHYNATLDDEWLRSSCR